MTFGKWLGFIAVILSLFILWQIRQLVLLLFTAVIVANALNLLVSQLQGYFNFWGDKVKLTIGKWKIGLVFKALANRSYSVVIALVIVVVGLVLLFGVLIPPLVEQLKELGFLIPKGFNLLLVGIKNFKAQLSPDISDLLPDVDQIQASLTSQIQPLFKQLINQGWNVFASGVGAFINIFLLLILTLMLLLDPLPYRQGFIRLFPSFYRRRADEILLKCEVSLKGWVLGLLFNMAVITVLSFVSLLAVRIRLPLAQAILAGILTLIPNIGPGLSVVFPMIIGFIDAPWKSVVILGCYVGIQQFETHLLTPVVMAQQLALLPAVTLLSQIFFATFFGFLGLFLALPLTVIGQVWFKEVVLRDILDRWELSS